MAIKDLDKGLEVEPSNAQLLYRVGLAYYANGEYRQCIK